TENEEKINLGINFNTSSTIIIHYKNVKDSILFEIDYCNLFPNDFIENKLILTKEEGVEKQTFNIQHPQKVEFSFLDFSTTCFLVPDDTLEIHIDFDSTQNIKNNMKYVGKYATISDYYKNKELFFNKSDFNYPKAMAFNYTKKLDDYLSIMDSLTHDELDYIDNYAEKKLLPKWFIDYELTEIKSFTASSKISIVMFRKRFLGLNDTIPKNYFSVINNFMIDCPNSILSLFYLDYLSNYLQHLLLEVYDTSKTLSREENNKQLIDLAKSNLNEETSDLFLAFYLDMIISINRLDDETYSLYYDTIKNKQLKKYLADRKEKGMILKSGDDAPPFCLPNIEGKECSLKDFKGNIVYLSFWYPGCKPCLEEFNDENKLVEKFIGKKVKFINICTSSDIETWKAVTNKYKLKTINLFANDTLDNFIEKNYDIKSYPQHVLIDQNGKIIQNKCARPYEVENELNQLLSK
ncbi:MAG: hypothetical protein A3K10_15415, partial [Bacteroidetes bacterium RIFCSPLOWO2_12_FULL_31_6]